MGNKPFQFAAAAAASLLFSNPAWSAGYTAPSKTGTGRVVLLEPLAFVKVDDLAFGGFIIPTTGSDTVAVNASTGVVTNGASLVQLPQFAQQRGHFMGAGTPSQGVTITATLPAKLYLNGNTASATWINVNLNLDVAPQPDGSYSYTIASDKSLNVYVGGDITIAAGMTPGLYSNVYDLTATYQ